MEVFVFPLFSFYTYVACMYISVCVCVFIHVGGHTAATGRV